MSRRFWERLQLASEIALLVGCVLVVLGLVFEDWIKSLLGIGEIAVVVGVMIEGLADGGIFLASGKLKMIQESELEQMRLGSAQANERAEEARRAAAEANAQTASLQLQLEVERQKRAQRSLTTEQKDALVAELKGKIRRINVVIQRDWESKAFALQLEIVFQEAGAQLGEYAMPPGEILPVSTGVMMYKPGGANSEDDLKGDPLYSALKKAGLFGGFAGKPIVSPNLLDPARLPEDEYAVYVGQKPPW